MKADDNLRGKAAARLSPAAAGVLVTRWTLFNIIYLMHHVLLAGDDGGPGDRRAAVL